MADWPGATAAASGFKAPARATYPRPAKKTVELPDPAPFICRICRGEGTPEEPLFCPCKCSGSIQHVHQDCLMEWLSHSQKKYCELCKTSFRFTKFYSPSMPQRLPVSVFFQQILRYVIEHAFSWLRVVIAISFWVSGLPLFTRSGWSSMFWISQESWGSSSSQAASSTAVGDTIELSSTMLGHDMCPASPLFAPNRTSVESAETLQAWGATLSITDFLLRSMFHLFGVPVFWAPIATSNVTNVAAPGNQSLLGNVNFLRTLTSNNTVNKSVILILEGQIVTIVVIVSFILVILVRDYVVQQQPEINRAGFEPAADADAEPVRAQAVQGRQRPADNGDASDDDEAAHDAENPDLGWRHRPPTPIPDAPTPEGAARHATDAEVAVAQRAITDALGPGYTVLDAEVGNRAAPTAPVRHPAPYAPVQGSSDGGSSPVEYTPGSTDHSQSDLAELDSTDKGKGQDTTWPLPRGTAQSGTSRTIEPDAGPSRPRAISDGPQAQGSVNPLANNSWTFTGVNVEPPTREHTSTAERPVAQPMSSTSSHRSMGESSATDREAGVEPTRPPGARRFNSIRDQIDANEDVYQPPMEGHIIRIPSPSASAPPPSPPVPPAPSAVAPQEPQLPLADYLMQAAADFMWNDLTDTEEPEHADAAGEEPHEDDGTDDDDWVDVPDGDAQDEDLEPNVQPGGLGMEADLGLDADAMDDMEDFEGIMELLGMRGPITNLFQNVIFCAVLVQSALVACVFGPFNTGRLSLWILAKPVRLVRIVFEFSKLLQDLAFIIIGFGSWMLVNIIDIFTARIGGSLAAQVVVARKGSWAFFVGAASRVVDFISFDASSPGSGIQNWSAISRQALISIKQQVSSVFCLSQLDLGAMLRPDHLLPVLGSAVTASGHIIVGLPKKLMNPDSWVIEFSSERNATVDLELASWSAADISWAILAGYATIFLAAALYMKSGIKFSRGTVLEDWETGLIDSLHQASGILKVITIIGIEMLVFPLYCGLLLDCALLPLFTDATFKSRMLFTYNNPWTSVFVHWFVGTGYMFHFALFVSMCRKIMRPGVLYFIRDPDDPEFHPVRDVLERNLVTQLRKILFSAFVYGALVIVCLGGVVWGLAFAAPNVLPIHYSSNEPVLEFPVDLLFYTFIMPLAFRVFKPGQALHAMYKWCFRKSARILRLTYFIFGERRIDEEGTLQLAEKSPYASLPIYQRYFLGLDPSLEKVVPKTLSQVLDGVEVRSSSTLPQENQYLRRKKGRLIESGQMIKDGGFVRAPASDRVKIPKGRRVFLDVNERNQRLDGKPDDGLYASKQYSMVYVPPHLLPRVFLFILFIWTFAAVTGVGLTILPLMFGRMLFKTAIPEGVRTNDIYAFCIGIHVLGLIGYTLVKGFKFITQPDGLSVAVRVLTTNGLQWNLLFGRLIYGAKLLYAYTFTFVVFPLVLSTLVELYVAIPAHTYINPPTGESMKTGSETGSSPTEHSIGVIQSWTLGLLYMRLSTRLVNTFYRRSRFSKAMRAVFRRGWGEPDVNVLTRAFIIPGLVMAAAAVFIPPYLCYVVEKLDAFEPVENPADKRPFQVYRYRQSYPVAFCLCFSTQYFVAAKGKFRALKVKIRDDAYLMGERLQNYDGSPVPDPRSARAAPGGGRR